MVLPRSIRMGHLYVPSWTTLVRWLTTPPKLSLTSSSHSLVRQSTMWRTQWISAKTWVTCVLVMRSWTPTMQWACSRTSPSNRPCLSSGRCLSQTTPPWVHQPLRIWHHVIVGIHVIYHIFPIQRLFLPTIKSLAHQWAALYQWCWLIST